jgi:hypothetical protein
MLLSARLILGLGRDGSLISESTSESLASGYGVGVEGVGFGLV